MTRNKTFLIVQSVFCALIAGLLAAAALQLYFDGAAKQAEGEIFNVLLKSSFSHYALNSPMDLYGLI